MAVSEFNSIICAKINAKDLERKIRVGAVSYLNTKPLLYGIQRSPVIRDMELIIDYPSRIAEMLLNDEIDMGLVPVAIIPRMREFHINGTHCIGCKGPVASVCIFSERPLEEVSTILLDYQSRTSVQLAKLLVKKYWKISPEMVDAGADFQERIKGRVAGLVIGDRALEQRKVSPFIYDLGEAWDTFTGLPFVFAAWISNKALPADFVGRFDAANGMGLEQIDKVIAENPFSAFDLRRYFTRHLDYRLGDPELKGLEKFLSYLGAPELSIL
jgi:chorismate dehydratase